MDRFSEGEYIYKLLKRRDRGEYLKTRVPTLLIIIGVIFIPFILSVYLIDDTRMIDFSNLILSTQTLSNDALAITLGIVFGFAGLAVAVYFGFSQIIKDFLTEAKKGQIDEKIAMLYDYANKTQDWSEQGIPFPPYLINRIEADVTSICRIKRSIKDEQLTNLLAARDALLREMRPHYSDEADRIQRIFRTYYLW